MQRRYEVFKRKKEKRPKAAEWISVNPSDPLIPKLERKKEKGEGI